MIAVAVWRWVLAGLFGSPAVWILSLLLCLGLPLLHSLRPLPTSVSAWDQAMPWVLPAGLLGMTLALVTFSRGIALLERLDPMTRLEGEFGGLLLAGLCLQLPILSGALLSGATLTDVGAGLPAILTFTLHLASIALLLLTPALPTTLRASLFLSLVWLVPALCSAGPRFARLATWIDVRSPLRSAASVGLPSLLSALALLMTVYLVRSAPARETPG